MKVQLLICQRRQRFPGEIAPEVMAVVDEYVLDDNPDWWPNEINAQKDGLGEKGPTWGLVEVEVPDDVIQRSLEPVARASAPVSAQVVEGTEA